MQIWHSCKLQNQQVMYIGLITWHTIINRYYYKASISKKNVKSYLSVSSIDSIHLNEGNSNMPSCYGAIRSGYEACRTCSDVKEAYYNMGWEMKDEKISQCTGNTIICKCWSDYNSWHLTNNNLSVWQVYILKPFINRYRVRRRQHPLWHLGCKRWMYKKSELYVTELQAILQSMW